jgi:hypothetical protein
MGEEKLDRLALQASSEDIYSTPLRQLICEQMVEAHNIPQVYLPCNAGS